MFEKLLITHRQNKLFSIQNCNNKEKRWVVNLSNVQLTEAQISVLELGLNFVITPKHINKHQILASVEQGIWKLPPGEADIFRSKVTSILKRHNSIECNLRPWGLKAIKELRSLSDILFIKADKGNMTVIMKKQDYDEKLFKMLSNDETYENLKRDQTAKTEKLLNKSISTKKLHKVNASS